MAAPTNAANVKKALANSEPSTHGPSGHNDRKTLGPLLTDFVEKVCGCEG